MITTIIFDFAGVVSRRGFFPVVAENLSKKYGIPEESIKRNLETHVVQYMLGKETTEEFWKKVCGELNIPQDEFIQIFGSSYELNTELLDFIDELKTKYHVFLHSDNFAALSSVLRKEEQLVRRFEKMFFSDEMHLVKEDEASFRHVLQEVKKEPSECVFIDDKEINLISPRNLGMQVLLFKNTELLKQDLNTLLAG